MSNADHRKLDAWRLALEAAKETYRLTARLPSEEKFGLVAQMRRAAVSVPSNLAEGAARGSTGELGRFAAIARGSLAELQTQLILCFELGYIHEQDELDKLIERLFKVLSGLIRRCRQSAR